MIINIVSWRDLQFSTEFTINKTDYEHPRPHFRSTKHRIQLDQKSLNSKTAVHNNVLNRKRDTSEYFKSMATWYNISRPCPDLPKRLKTSLESYYNLTIQLRVRRSKKRLYKNAIVKEIDSSGYTVAWTIYTSHTD